MFIDPLECLALVERSPAAVAVHDKRAWLDLFASYNIVEDPVGSRPHLSGVYDAREGRRGAGPLSRFYDTVIAPNSIRFDVERDIVCGLHVVRDLTIEITMAPDVLVCTPMHLRYELCRQQGELKIFRLAAHWELMPVLRQQAGAGQLTAALSSGMRMARNLGVGGVWGFMGALSSVGEPGKRQVQRFERYFNDNNSSLASLFETADAPVWFADQERRLTAAQLSAEDGRLSFTKLLAAGNFVTASCCLETQGESRRGVAFFQLDRRRLCIVGLELYLEH